MLADRLCCAEVEQGLEVQVGLRGVGQQQEPQALQVPQGCESGPAASLLVSQLKQGSKAGSNDVAAYFGRGCVALDGFYFVSRLTCAVQMPCDTRGHTW